MTSFTALSQRFISTIALIALIMVLTAGSLLAQGVEITFNVRMQYYITEDLFDPETEFVDLAGSFNGWGSELTQMSDNDNDSVYTVTVGGFSAGEEIAFKFRINGEWEGREEFPGGGPNRSYRVQSSDNVITKWYNDEEPPSGPPAAEFSVGDQTVEAGDAVRFMNNSGGIITNYEWSFEGATPSTSTDEEPSVLYLQPGLFDVQLIARNSDTGVADTLTKTEYITVAEAVDRAPEGELGWWNDRVFYEIFVRSFYDSDGNGIGDFQGIIEKLDYLNDGDPTTTDDLGITGIWLMPIHESPTYHGYDAIDYRSINPDYGTMQDFEAFVAAAHERGIAVIIDYVMNHSSTEHPWFIESRNNRGPYRDYYRWADSNPNQTGPWGQQVWHEWGGDYYYGLFWGGMPDLNYDNTAVRDSMFAIADFWIEEKNIDGFRLDAVLYIDEDAGLLENTPGTFQFWQDFNAHIKATDPEVFSVGEAWTSSEQIEKYVTNDRLDYAFEFNLATRILEGVNRGEGYAMLDAIEDAYHFYPNQQFGTFLTNHDQNRVMDVFGDDVSKAKLAASIYLTIPGIPYLYYGEEIAMKGSKPDPDIRLPMQWSSGRAGGFTTGSPWRGLNSNYTTYNVADLEQEPTSILNHYKRLIQLRNSESALRTGAVKTLFSANDAIAAYLREDTDQTLLVIHNLSPDPLSSEELWLPDITLEEGSANYTDRLNGGVITVTQSNDGQAGLIQDLALESRQTIVLDISGARTISNEPQSGNSPRQFELHQNYPNPFNPATTITYELAEPQQVTLTVYDAVGRTVRQLVNSQQSAGNHTVRFSGQGLASGLYIYRLEAGGRTEIRKMMLVK